MGSGERDIRQVVELFGVNLSHPRPKGLAGLLIVVVWPDFIHVLDEIADGLIAVASGACTH